MVLIFGDDMRGFAQLYPTLGIRLICDNWAYSMANARELLHAVSKGTGLRISLAPS
jgi:hypothetical protein